MTAPLTVAFTARATKETTGTCMVARESARRA